MDRNIHQMLLMIMTQITSLNLPSAPSPNLQPSQLLSVAKEDMLSICATPRLDGGTDEIGCSERRQDISPVVRTVPQFGSPPEPGLIDRSTGLKCSPILSWLRYTSEYHFSPIWYVADVYVRSLIRWSGNTDEDICNRHYDQYENKTEVSIFPS